MKCKHCGKIDYNLLYYKYNYGACGICEECNKKLESIIPQKDSLLFEETAYQMGLSDAFYGVKMWLKRDFSIVRFIHFKEDSRLKFNKVLVYGVVAEMNMGEDRIVKFPAIVEVRLIGNKENKVKVTYKDGERVRDFYTLGKLSENTLKCVQGEVRYTKTDMKYIKELLKDCL